ncbi:MAG: pitrilysin family protein [Candidatus Eisenbacteria bacterium]
MNFLRRVGNVDQPEPIRRQLSNGLLLLAEPVPGVPSLALGAWVKSGSQHESKEMMGAAHFIEHLVFKGTRKRSAYQIAQRLEALGGQVDAFTTKETTCFHARIFAGHRKSAANILGELLSDATFPRPEVEKERQVIVEEIHAYEDTPEEFVFDLATEKIWDGHSMGHSILGRLDTLKAMGTRDLQRFHRDHYTRPNMIVTAAGNVDVDRLVDEIEASFRVPTRAHAEQWTHGPLPKFQPTTTHLDARSAADVYLSHGAWTVGGDGRVQARCSHPPHDPGGGHEFPASSRGSREVHGLAYSVYSYMEVLKESGIFCIYLAVQTEGSAAHCATRRA